MSAADIRAEAEEFAGTLAVALKGALSRISALENAGPGGGGGFDFRIGDAIRTFDPTPLVTGNNGLWVLLDGRSLAYQPWLEDIVVAAFLNVVVPDNLTSVYLPMTSGTAPAPQVATESSRNSTQRGGWNIFTSAATNWVSGNLFANNSGGATGNQYATLDLGAGNSSPIFKVMLTVDTDVNQTPKDYKVQGSADGTTWDDLVTRVGETWTASETKEYAIAQEYMQSYYRYFRLLVTRITYPSNTQLTIRELKLFRRPSFSLIDTLDDFGQRLLLKVAS